MDGLADEAKRNVTKLEKHDMKVSRGVDDRNRSVTSQPSANPLWASTTTLAAEGSTNVSQSIYEAKGGMRVACLSGGRQDECPFSLTRNNAYVKKLCKDLAAHMRSTGAMKATNPFRDIPNTKKVLGIWRKSFDNQCFTALVLPDQQWAAPVYALELFGTAERHVDVFTTGHCTAELRMYIAGSEDIIGLPYREVPGESFKEKRQNVSRMTVDGLKTVVAQTTVFVLAANMDDDRLVMIPSGFLLVTASHGATYVRKGLSADEQDSCRVKFMLSEVLASFQEFRSDPYSHQQLHGHLDDDQRS